MVYDSRFRADGSPADNDLMQFGPSQLAFDEWATSGIEVPNLSRMREYRLQRLCAELEKRDYAGILLTDPVNIRYASDSTNMQLWVAHNPARACFVSTDGYVLIWDCHNCEHLSDHLPLVSEVRTMTPLFFFESGRMTKNLSEKFAEELDTELRRHGGDNRRLAIDKIEWLAGKAIEAKGIEIFEGQEVTECARLIKGPDEINAARCSIAACEASVAVLESQIRPGISELELWSYLHAENIRRGGEWIETRIMSSGPRTNPWYQECSARVMEKGDLIALDTDLIGPYGMCADISRTWLVGGGKPTDEQSRLFSVAQEHIVTNMDMLKPGVSFAELTEKSHRLPEEFRSQRYGIVMHGVGLCDEFPGICYPEDYAEGVVEGFELEPGMMLCVEAYIGEVGGREGVKLEDQVLITEFGYENLTRYSFDQRLI